MLSPSSHSLRHPLSTLPPFPVTIAPSYPTSPLYVCPLPTSTSPPRLLAIVTTHTRVNVYRTHPEYILNAPYSVSQDPAFVEFKVVVMCRRACNEHNVRLMSFSVGNEGGGAGDEGRKQLKAADGAHRGLDWEREEKVQVTQANAL